MAEITISLSNVHNIKRVRIDEIGDFKVRRMGAGEELDLSDKLRRLNAIIDELNTLDFKGIDLKKPTKKAIAKLDEMTKRSEELMDEINEIKRFELESYARCFDDGGDGSKTKLLLDSLSDEDRANLFRQIFEPARILKPTEVTEAPKPVADKKVKKAKNA